MNLIKKGGNKIKSSEKEIIIEPGNRANNYWEEIWSYRELFYFLVWRDILVRYKQTVIGVAWSVIRPLLTMIIFTVVFGKIAKLPSGGVPYPILVFTAMLPWHFFANSITASSNSLIANAGMISKIYFPRFIIPSSSIIVGAVDFFISFILMTLFMVYFKFIPQWTILTLPFFMLLAFILSLGVGLFFSALNVKYRDIRHIIPFITQIGLYISPVGFSSNLIPYKWRLLYSINPIVGIIDGFRWAILGNKSPLYIPSIFLSLLISLLIFILSLWYFHKTERTFADLI